MAALELQGKFCLAGYLSTRIVRQHTTHQDAPFRQLCRQVKEHLDDSLNRVDSAEFLQLQHEAIIGKRGAQTTFKRLISEFLRRELLDDVPYPPYYASLTEGVFEKLYGLGPLSHWFRQPQLQSAEVNGTAILYQRGAGKELQDFHYESLDEVQTLITRLTMRDASTQVNEFAPFEELEMENGTRVTIWVPPVTPHPILVFRKYPFRVFTFAEEARHHTVDGTPEAQEWLQLLAAPLLNVVISGPKNSGKTTLAKVWYHYRPPHYQTATVERDMYEIRLTQDFRDRAAWIKPFRLTEAQIRDFLPGLLRSDCKWIFFPEVRSVEVDLAFGAAEQGFPVLMTFHATDVVNMPGTMARRVIDAYPHRSFLSEYLRIGRTLDLVVRMEELPDGTKILESIDAIVFDDLTNTVTIHPWMRYDYDDHHWHYRFDVPASLAKRLHRELGSQYARFIELFSRLAQQQPLIADVLRPDLNVFVQREVR